MAADAEVMRQFLVSLGYQVNEIQQRKFDTAVNKTDKTVLNLGKTLLGAAAAAQALVIGFANSFERLYYLSQRTGASVGDLKAAGYAGRQIGTTAQAIESTIANISRAIKENPGTESFISWITGKPTAGRSPAKLLEEIIGGLKSKPDYEAFQIAGQLGIDPDTYLQLKNNLQEYLAQEEKQRQVYALAGIDADKAAEQLKQFNVKLREVELRAEAAGTSIALKLLPAFEHVADFTSFLLDSLNDKLKEGSKEKSFAEAANDVVSSPWDIGAEAGLNIRRWLFGEDQAPGVRKVSGKVVDEPSRSPTILPNTRGARNFNPGNIKYGPFARRAGAVGSDSGGFAIFPDLQTGTAALQSLAQTYLSTGRDTLDSFINSYSATDQGPYKRFLAGRLGIGVNDRLTVAQIPSLVGGIGTFESGFNPLGAGGINQTNNFNIYGSGDVHSTAAAVANSQQRVNASLVRDLKGGIR